MKHAAGMPFAIACLGVAIFSGMDAVMKHLAIEIGSYNAMLWRTVFSMVALGPLYLLRGGRWPEAGVLKLHVLRGTAMGVSLVLFFWGLRRVSMAQGIALSFVAPLIALGLAALFLKEKVARAAVFASLLAFAGVLVILLSDSGKSGGATDWQSPIAILLAAFLYAVGVVAGRPLAQRAAPLEVAFFFNLVAGGMALAGAPWLGAALPEPRHLPALFAATIASNISIMLMAWAYARAEMQHLLPVEYTAFIWAALFGWLAFGEAVSLPTLCGALLIVAACLLAARGQPRAIHAEPEMELADSRSHPVTP